MKRLLAVSIEAIPEFVKVDPKMYELCLEAKGVVSGSSKRWKKFQTNQIMPATFKKFTGVHCV